MFHGMELKFERLKSLVVRVMVGTVSETVQLCI